MSDCVGRPCPQNRVVRGFDGLGGPSKPKAPEFACYLQVSYFRYIPTTAGVSAPLGFTDSRDHLIVNSSFQTFCRYVRSNVRHHTTRLQAVAMRGIPAHDRET